MFHMYALLSAMTDRPLSLPMHQLKINEDDVAIAADTVQLSDAGEAVPLVDRPSAELVAYSRFVLSEVNAGRGIGRDGGITNLVHLGGVTEILPAKQPYTKKIVVLNNELTFSAGEFLAAILQDSKRATIFGHTTAGAGGCARRIHSPDSERMGMSLTLTWTIAYRTNGLPIENVGIVPDVPYTHTVEDLRSGYAGYRQALLTTLDA